MTIARMACWFAAMAGSVYGFQAGGSIEGQILNLATGAPLKRATVRLMGLGRRPQGAGPNMQAKETDDQGKFAFVGLEAGRYLLSAERQGFLRQNYGGRKYNTSGTAMVLGADQRMKDIVLKMSPQSVITGKVLDEDGEPVANVQVRAMKMAYRDGRKQWVQTGNGSTSDIGEYRIPSLDPGRYLIATNQLMRGPGMMQTAPTAPLPDTPDLRYASTYYPSTLDESNAVPVDVAPGAEARGIDVRLVKTQVFRIRGRVGVPEGGRGAPMVMLVRKDGGRVAGNQGPARPPDFRFEIPGVSPGSYIVFAQFRGGGQQESIALQPVEVQNRHVDNIMLNLSPGADVAGTLKVEDATSPVDVSKVNVMLRPLPQMGNPPRARVAEGAFVLKNVPPLHYVISVSGVPEGCYVKSIRYGGREAPSEGVDITAGAAIDVTLSATAGDISAAAVDKDGKPVAGAMVALIAKDGGPVRGNTADENGAVSFTGLKPGDYGLIAWEDIPPGAHNDPEFIKQYSATTVKLEARGKQGIQVKAVVAQ
jgi:uncharacterized GH25 family protein